MLLTFPSTFQAEFRRLKGAEISAMANRSDAASSDTISELLRATWVKTLDPGPYAWEQQSNGKPSVLGADGALMAAPQFDKMLSGDLIVGLLWTAIDSVPNGALYRFPVQCERQHPKRQYEWSINLESQLLAPPVDEHGKPIGRVAVRSLSAATVEHLRTTGNRFSTTVQTDDGPRSVVYKLQSPSDEKPTADLRKLVKRFTHAEQCAVQVIEIEGLKSTAVAARWEWMKQLDGHALYSLFAEFESNDCGVETDISTKCPECEWEQSQALPFGRLFSPRRP